MIYFFEPGQKVLCINDAPTVIDTAKGIKAGEIYTVRRFSKVAKVNYLNTYISVPILTFEEVKIGCIDGIKTSLSDRYGYLAERFVDVDHPRIKIFRDMCNDPNLGPWSV
jgi:hypothetical protein